MKLRELLTPDELEDDYISGIHNYCDRWCERCSMTTRCRVFAMEQETTDEERDITNEAFWGNLQNIFAQTNDALQQIAEEHGLDLNDVNEEEFSAHCRRMNRLLKEENLTQLTEGYVGDAKAVLENKNDWLMFSAAADEETQNEMLSVIYWYQNFIASKVRRGLNGILDSDENIDEEELNDPQSDSNGSIKIALVGVTRSIMAWTALMSRENAAQIRPLIELLESIRQTAEKKFPGAKGFIRPGFDEIETVM